MYTLDGDIAKAIIIVYEQYCLNTLSNDAINSFNFVISNTDTEIHVTIRTKKLTLGGVASYVIDRDCYTIISEEYYE